MHSLQGQLSQYQHHQGQWGPRGPPPPHGPRPMMGPHGPMPPNQMDPNMVSNVASLIHLRTPLQFRSSKEIYMKHQRRLEIENWLEIPLSTTWWLLLLSTVGNSLSFILAATVLQLLPLSS